MKQKYQVTIICGSGAYKPLSTLVEVEQTDETADLSKDKNEKQKIIKRGITKICASRNWSSYHLKQYDYTKVKIRKYDKLAIEKQKKENYEKLKEEKYASGEWKKPKFKAD